MEIVKKPTNDDRLFMEIFYACVLRRLVELGKKTKNDEKSDLLGTSRRIVRFF